MTLKVGDRVKVRDDKNYLARFGLGRIVAVPGVDYVEVLFDGKRYPGGCAKTPGAGTHPPHLFEKVESVPFKLERGDKVVNRKTGREGNVVVGTYGDLWVVDYTYCEDTGALASALEEYEEHFPGTYDLIKKDAPW